MSKPCTAPPKRTGNAVTSMRVIGPIPLLPLTTASQADGTVLPTGEMIPRPVTTTRRLLTLYLCGASEGCDARGRAECARRRPRGVLPWTSRLCATLVDVINRLVDGRDLLGILIRDLDLELLFQSHHQLDRIQRVRSQIINERGIVGDLLLLDAQLLGNDCLDLLFNRAHHSFV